MTDHTITSHCESCKEPVYGTRFCEACGHRVETAPVPEARSRRRGVLIASAVGFGIAMIGGGIRFRGRRGSEEDARTDAAPADVPSDSNR